MPYHSCQRVIGVGSVWIGSIIASVTEITLKWRLKQRANEQLLMLSLHPPLLSLLHIQSFLIYRPTNSLRCSALLSSPLLFCFTPTHDLPYQLSSLTAETQSSLLLASWPLWCLWLKSRYLTPWWLEQRTSLRALWGNPRTIHCKCMSAFTVKRKYSTWHNHCTQCDCNLQISGGQGGLLLSMLLMIMTQRTSTHVHTHWNGRFHAFFLKTQRIYKQRGSSCILLSCHFTTWAK